MLVSHLAVHGNSSKMRHKLAKRLTVRARTSDVPERRTVEQFSFRAELIRELQGTKCCFSNRASDALSDERSLEKYASLTGSAEAKM